MRICFFGAGGLGSVLGGRLAATGVDVTLVARPAHAEAVAANGLTILANAGTAVVTDNLTAVAHAEDAVGDFDYLVLLVKAKDTEAALADAKALRDRTAPRCRSRTPSARTTSSSTGSVRSA